MCMVAWAMFGSRFSPVRVSSVFVFFMTIVRMWPVLLNDIFSMCCVSENFEIRVSCSAWVLGCDQRNVLSM